MKRRTVTASVLLLAAMFTPPGDARADPTAEEVHRRAEDLRPRPGRLKWQNIPWMTNLAEGLKVATEERRPVFLWGSDDEPLERC